MTITTHKGNYEGTNENKDSSSIRENGLVNAVPCLNVKLSVQLPQSLSNRLQHLI